MTAVIVVAHDPQEIDTNREVVEMKDRVEIEDLLEEIVTIVDA